MAKVLVEADLLKVGEKYVKVKILRVHCSGGSRVDYVDADGNILKSEAFSRSKYSRMKEEK